MINQADGRYDSISFLHEFTKVLGFIIIDIDKNVSIYVVICIYSKHIKKHTSFF